MYWCCIGMGYSLVMYWLCGGIVLDMCWQCYVLVIHWFGLVMCWFCIGYGSVMYGLYVVYV